MTQVKPGMSLKSATSTRRKARLILRHDSDEMTDKDVVITINGTGLTWDDVQFEGPNQPPVLQPI